MSSFIDNFRAQMRIAGKKFAATLFNNDEGLTPSAIRLLRNLLKGFPQLTIEQSGQLTTRDIEVFNIGEFLSKNCPKLTHNLRVNTYFRKNEAAQHLFAGMIQGMEDGYKKTTAIPPSDLASAREKVELWKRERMRKGQTMVGTDESVRRYY